MAPIAAIYVHVIGTDWTAVWLGAVVSVATTLLAIGAAFALQKWVDRNVRRESIEAFVDEVRHNAIVLRQNRNISRDERSSGSFSADTMVPLSTFALDRLPLPLPRALLVNVKVTGSDGAPRNDVTSKRIGAQLYLSSMRFSANKLALSIARHETALTQPAMLSFALGAVDVASTSCVSAMWAIATFMLDEEDAAVVRGSIDPENQWADHIGDPEAES